MLPAAAAAQQSRSERAREGRAETPVRSVTRPGAIVVLAVDINSGMSLSYLQYAQRCRMVKPVLLCDEKLLDSKLLKQPMRYYVTAYEELFICGQTSLLPQISS